MPEFWGSAQFKSGLDYPDYPVVGVSSSDAEQYARWAGKRLPTEAEWEYAARGGLIDKNFPWGDQVDSAKVNYGKKFKGILKVGSFPPNNFGLFDITGNVWEWTSDYYGDNYYKTSPAENPKGPSDRKIQSDKGRQLAFRCNVCPDLLPERTPGKLGRFCCRFQVCEKH